MRARRKLFPVLLGAAAVLALLLLLMPGSSKWPGLALTSWAGEGRGDDKDIADEPAFEEVVNSALPSVVQIQAVRREPFTLGPEQLEDFFVPYGQGLFGEEVEEVNGLGAGMVIREDGYIVTSRHLLTDATAVHVVLHDGSRMEAEVIGSNPEFDVAVIRIPAIGLTPVQFGDDTDIRVGEWVVAIGSPLSSFFNNSVTAGVITQILPFHEEVGDGYAVLKTDAALNYGNSGGPLVNLDGQVVGMASVPFQPGHIYTGIGYALVSAQVKWVAEAIIEGGSRQQQALGVEYGPVVADQRSDAGAAEIIHVTPGSAAASAGMLRGDIVVALDGEPLESHLELTERIAIKEPGDAVRLTINRSGQTMEVEILLSTYNPFVADTLEASSDDPNQRLVREMGFSVADVEPEDVKGLSYGVETGVVVVFVDATSDAYQDGDLRGGMVITEMADQEIHNLDDFHRVYTSIPSGVYFLVMVFPQEGGVLLTALEKPEVPGFGSGD